MVQLVTWGCVMVPLVTWGECYGTASDRGLCHGAQLVSWGVCHVTASDRGMCHDTASGMGCVMEHYAMQYRNATL